MVPEAERAALRELAAAVDLPFDGGHSRWSSACARTVTVGAFKSGHPVERPMRVGVPDDAAQASALLGADSHGA